MLNLSSTHAGGKKLRRVLYALVAAAIALSPCYAFGAEGNLELIAGVSNDTHLGTGSLTAPSNASLIAQDAGNDDDADDTGIVASSKCGTCIWTIDEQGTLTIAPQEGAEGTLERWNTPPWYRYRGRVASVRIEGLIHVLNCRFFFDGCKKLTNVDLTGLETSKATDMKCMFGDCSSLQSLDLSALDSSSAVDMSYMFSSCSSLESLDLRPLVVWNATEMNGMFANCSSLRSLNLSSLDTSSATTMNSMFEGCWSLESLDLSEFDTSNVLVMSNMFNQCSSLRSLDLSSLDTSNVEAVGSMFSGCTSLETVWVNDTWPAQKLQDSPLAFYNCTSLVGGNGTVFDADCVTGAYARIDAEGAPGYLTYKASPHATIVAEGTWGTCSWEIDAAGVLWVHPGTGGPASVKRTFADGVEYDVSYWRDYANLIKSVTFLEEDGRKVVAPADTGYLFSYLDVESVDLRGLDTAHVKSMGFMFRHCSSLRTLNLTPLDVSGVSNMECLLANCPNLHTLDLSGLDASSVTDISGMLDECLSLKSLNLTSFRTPKAKYMNGMFEDCSSLRSLDLAGFDTSSAENMARMFYGCSSLLSLDLSGFDTANLKHMGCMFEACSALRSIDLSSFDTSGVDTMGYLFEACSSLESLDLSNFDTVNVTDMNGMFEGCWSLESLDLSEFDTSNVEYCAYMFSSCYSLCTIYASESWTMKNSQGGVDMFLGCNDLVGGNGTAYDFDHTDAEYARIDAEGTPGYLTYKKSSGKGSHSKAGISIAGAIVKLSPAVFEYNGKAHTPKVSVTLDGTKLAAGKDYTVSYSAGRTSAGTYQVTVTGMGDYSSKAKATFKVTKATLAKSHVTLKKTDLPFNGKARTPTVVVKVGSTTLKAGRDYTVVLPKNRKNVGRYRLKVVGTGNYKGKVSARFAIVPKTPALESLVAHKNSNGTSGFIASWSKSAKNGCGYQLRWSRSKAFSVSESITFADTSSYAKSATAALRVRTANWLGKRIYVQVRSFQQADGETLYSAWSKERTTKLKK